MDFLNDNDLLRQFEKADIPLSEWNHRTHLRIAYSYLRKNPLPVAFEKMQSGVQAFNKAKGIEDGLLTGYHETMTFAYLSLIDFTMKQHGAAGDSLEFLATQPQVCAKSLLRFYYSKEQFCSWEAKKTFLEPDLAPFPIPKSDAAPEASD